MLRCIWEWSTVERGGFLQDQGTTKSCLWCWTPKGRCCKSKEAVVFLGTSNKQCTYWARLLLPCSGNLCLLPICLPILNTHRPSPRCPHLCLQGSSCRQDPTSSAPRHWGQAMAVGRMLHPHQTPRGLLATWTIKIWIKNLMPLQVPSAFCLRHVHPAARRCNCAMHRHSRGGRGHESTGRYPGCQQALTAHCDVCASAASDFAAHPRLPAVWVVQHVLQCCLSAAVWRYSTQEPNACRWLQQRSQGRLTAV